MNEYRWSWIAKNVHKLVSNFLLHFFSVVFVKLRRELISWSKILVNCVLHSLPKFWAQSENSQLVYQLFALENAKPQLAYKVEVVHENN